MGAVTTNSVLAWCLAAVFLNGAIVNWLAPRSIRLEYADLGLPDRSHYAIAAAEFLAAVMLSWQATRFFGALLSVAIMAAIIAVLLYHGKYQHTICPSALLTVAALLAVRLL